jgi:membrane protein
MRLIGGGRLSFREFFRRLYRAYQDDLLFDSAAQLSYYFLFSLFPFLFFLATLTAYLPVNDWVARLIPPLRALAPIDVSRFVEENLRTLTGEQRPRLMALSLLVSIFSASRGICSIRRALNLAYDVKESRPVWLTELVAVAVTIAGAVALLSVLALLVAGGQVGFWLAARFHVENAYVVVMQQLRWPLTALIVIGVMAAAYHLLPDVKQRLKFLAPGSILATILWLSSTWAFGEYVTAFHTYNVAYGSLGGMLVLLVWLYLSSFMFVLGGTVNAILEHASLTGKAQGARSEGQSAPPQADRPSALPPGATDSAVVAERSGAVK